MKVLKVTDHDHSKKDQQEVLKVTDHNLTQFTTFLKQLKVCQLSKNLEMVQELQGVRRPLVNCRPKTVLNWTFDY
jgi:hypothetical protein